MAKAKKQTKSSSPDAERNRLVKARFSDEEIADVRVAAALRDVPVSEFVRDAALEIAKEIIADRYSGK